MIRHLKIGHLLVAVIVGLLLMVPGSAFSAAEFYAIVDNFGKKPRNAYMDVSVDTLGGPADIQFNVFNMFGSPVAEFIVTTNSNGFASSASAGDLFDLTSGQPILIRARTLGNHAAAMLHIDSKGAPLTLGIWPSHRSTDGVAFSVGQEFYIAMGSFEAASLLVANVGGSEQVVDVHKGTRSADGSGIFSNPRLAPNAIWTLDLTQNEARSHLIVTSTGPIIVQLVVDDEKNIQSFQVLPRQ